MPDAKCGLCGEPMPPGEERFKYHGYSGPCPKPPLIAAAAPAPEDQHEVSKELLLPYGDVAPTLQTDALHELAETQNKAAPLSDDLIARKLAEQVIRETEGDHISFDEAIDKAEALIAAALRERAAPPACSACGCEPSRHPHLPMS